MDRCNEYWKGCVNWLVRCDVLREDHETLQIGAHIEVLAHTLRDGVLLCSLVNSLAPDCIDMENINHNPQLTRCLCIQNINIFLKACHEIFVIREQDLFEPTMLFDLSGFYEVLRTLSVLSNSSKALRRISPGFNVPPAGSNYSKHKLQIREVDKRRSLELSKNASASIHRESIRQENIYEKIVKQEISVDNAREKEEREFVLEEIIANEKSYLQNCLRVILESYMTPLKALLSLYDLKAIFGDIEKLAELHEDFYQDILKSLQPQNNLMLSDVFLRYFHRFLIYGEYCANLPRAQELLKIISSNKVDVKNVLNTCHARVKNCRLPLSDILVLPMTHILNYRRHLERLIKKTRADHPEADFLQRAYDAMDDVNNYVNDVKRDRDALQTIETIESRIIDLQMPGNKTLKDFGHLHKDDELRIKFSDQKIGTRYVFVFDQVMLICKTLRDGTYACQEALNLSLYKIKDMQVSTRWGHPWRLIHKHDDIEYVIHARNEDNKRTWMQAILEALDNIEPSAAKDNGHNFMMCTLEKPTMCHFCEKSLKGLIMQGYSCHYCNLVVHKMCIKEVGPCGAGINISKEETEHPLPFNSATTNRNEYSYLMQYPWFAGIVHREVADTILEGRRRGTFMLRISPKRHTNQSAAKQTEFAISLKTKTVVAHMLVFKRENGGNPQYYLSEARYFSSVVELMEFYKHWPLQENYNELDEVFTLPYKVTSDTELPSRSFNLVAEEADEEDADYLSMDGSEEKESEVKQLRNNCSTPKHLPDVSITKEFRIQTTHHSHIGRFETQEIETNPQYENLSPIAPERKSNSFGYETEDDSNSSSSNLQNFEMDLQVDLSAKSQPHSLIKIGNTSKEQYPQSHFVDTSTQTSSASEIYMNEEDIEKFGEYVVAALKLFRNPHSLRELTNDIRKTINNRLDNDH